MLVSLFVVILQQVFNSVVYPSLFENYLMVKMIFIAIIRGISQFHQIEIH